MRRPVLRIALCLLAAGIMTGLLGACSARQPQVPEVAVLLSDDVRLQKVEGLKEGLAQLGYPEGRITITPYSAEGDRSRLPALAAEAIATRPAILVAGGGIEALTLHQSANTDIPILLAGVASTTRWGLVESFAQPGGLATGLDNQHAELSGKRLELLTKLLPGIENVVVLYDPQVIPSLHAMEVTDEAASRLGVALVKLETRTLEQALDGLSQIQPGEYDAALFLPSFVLESGAAQITAELDRLRLPAMGALDLGAEAGLLAAYGNSNWAQGHQAARFVAKLLHGEAPGSIPIETPDNPELVVNLAVARHLGVELLPEGMAFAQVRGEGAVVAP